jgi:hypothetical protein
VGEIPLYFYVPLKRFFDGTDQENSKTQGGKGHQENSKKKKGGKNGGKKKKRFSQMWRFPYSFVLHWPGTPSCYHPPATFP